MEVGVKAHDRHHLEQMRASGGISVLSRSLHVPGLTKPVTVSFTKDGLASINAGDGAVAGWALPLWIPALRGLPAGATARAIAALAGIPPYAAVAVVVTLLLAALQTLAGAWLARALVPRRLSPASEDPGR
jgi:hypothetical protein